MSDGAGKAPREPILERLARLGLKNTPGPDPTRQAFRTKRFYRDLDEITFSRPYKPDNDKIK
jgi:hypothetical protein